MGEKSHSSFGRLPKDPLGMLPDSENLTNGPCDIR